MSGGTGKSGGTEKSGGTVKSGGTKSGGTGPAAETNPDDEIYSYGYSESMQACYWCLSTLKFGKQFGNTNLQTKPENKHEQQLGNNFETRTREHKLVLRIIFQTPRGLMQQIPKA